MRFVEFDADAAALLAKAGDSSRAAAKKRIENQAAGICGSENASLNQLHGLLRRVFSEAFFGGGGGGGGGTARRISSVFL
ncbi:MAG: hypothetical protein FD140_4007 [Limisphaerales bacterium]|nr:MAG: hypothetical protein FD140_4007 [Limisphaerales bacterium]